MKMILAYHWPGNIRELKWAIHHAAAIMSGDVIGRDELSLGADLAGNVGGVFAVNATVPFLEAKEKLEKQYIRNALALTQNNKTEAAKVLGISVRVLHYKIKKYHL